MMFTGAATDDEGCGIWAKQGKTVVLKNGEQGCRIFSGNQVLDVPSFSVEEVDPTGAGDTFCGAFLAALIDGKSLSECGRFANAAGAMSVRRQGPMLIQLATPFHHFFNATVFKNCDAVADFPKDLMDKFKMEAASEVGVNLKEGYNGDLTSREAGSVGGQMVKKMIESYEKSL